MLRLCASKIFECNTKSESLRISPRVLITALRLLNYTPLSYLVNSSKNVHSQVYEVIYRIDHN